MRKTRNIKLGRVRRERSEQNDQNPSDLCLIFLYILGGILIEDKLNVDNVVHCSALFYFVYIIIAVISQYNPW